MKKIFLALILTIVFLPLFSGNIFAQESSPNIAASPTFYDFGDVAQSGGPVSTTFEIQNTGNEILELYRLSTSCGCTTAEMDMSPLAPGETRVMQVTFDPLVHPNQLGSITRIVYLQTSDPVLAELEIELVGNVVKFGEPEVRQAIVFFNEACQDCGELVNEFYPVLFAEYDYELIRKDYINERENRKTLTAYNNEWGIPFELQSHIEAFVGENLLIGGHVPESIIRYLLEHPDEYERLLVYQDEMHGNGVDYKVWNFEGEIKTYPIDEPITTYLNGKDGSTSELGSRGSFWGLFAVITPSAFLDGINPCAIAVLLFFIAFLFSIKKTKQSIWKMGLVYISAIFLAYLLIGIGLAQAIIITGAPHLMAYVGAYLVIALGLIQLLGLIFPKFPIKLRIPINTKPTVEKWLHKSTLPAAFVGGFVVGLCTFPCSGGIYVAIIGMLAASQTYVQGLGWMVWYNLVFVAPLFIILALAGNPLMTEKLQRLERREARFSKFLIALTMIVLGLVILRFFIP